MFPSSTIILLNLQNGSFSARAPTSHWPDRRRAGHGDQARPPPPRHQVISASTQHAQPSSCTPSHLLLQSPPPTPPLLQRAACSTITAARPHPQATRPSSRPGCPTAPCQACRTGSPNLCSRILVAQPTPPRAQSQHHRCITSSCHPPINLIRCFAVTCTWGWSASTEAMCQSYDVCHDGCHHCQTNRFIIELTQSQAASNEG